MREWPWQFLFPQENLTLIPESKEKRRYHLYEMSFSHRLKVAVRMTGIHKRVTAHVFFAIRLRAISWWLVMICVRLIHGFR